MSGFDQGHETVFICTVARGQQSRLPIILHGFHLFSSLLLFFQCDADKCWHVAPDHTEIFTHIHKVTRQRTACRISSNLIPDPLGLPPLQASFLFLYFF